MLWLIEYKCGGFINGEEIEWLKIREGSVSFTLKSEPDNIMNVSEILQEQFVNNLQAINCNAVVSVETAYRNANTGD